MHYLYCSTICSFSGGEECNGTFLPVTGSLPTIPVCLRTFTDYTGVSQSLTDYTGLYHTDYTGLYHTDYTGMIPYLLMPTILRMSLSSTANTTAVLPLYRGDVRCKKVSISREHYTSYSITVCQSMGLAASTSLYWSRLWRLTDYYTHTTA